MKVRIAVAMYPTAGRDGAPVWIAYGREPWGPPSRGKPMPDVEALRELTTNFGGPDQATGVPIVRWIEAEIPLPEPAVVIGTEPDHPS